MRLTFFVLISFVCATYVQSQTIQGKVYDGVTTLKGLIVVNNTQNKLTETNANGDFNIVAQLGDSISFKSIFHKPIHFIVKPIHFKRINVFELKKVVNQLDEVSIKNKSKQPVFTKETYNKTLQAVILEDIKNNPHLYRPPGELNGGVNFLAVFGLIAKLFKSKKKTYNFEAITYKQYDSLFTNSSFFNDKLLTQSLNINNQQKYLFFEFCSAKPTSKTLLKTNKQLELLDALVKNAEQFKHIIKTYKTADSAKK